MRAFPLICWQLIAYKKKGLLLSLLLCAQRKGIQSAKNSLQGGDAVKAAFCSLTVVVEHIDQNILALFVFQRNKNGASFTLCFVPSLFIPALIDGLGGGALISSLSVRVGRWVVFRWSVPACAAAFVSSVSCLNGKSQCGLPDSSAVGCLVASLPGS